MLPELGKFGQADTLNWRECLGPAAELRVQHGERSRTGR